MYAIRTVGVAALAILALGACQPAAVVDADGVARANLKRPPPRQPGIWETRVVLGDVVQTTLICIDEKVDRKVDWMGAQGTRETCSESSITRQDDNSLRFSSVCDMGARGKVTTSGVARGDFSLRYEAEGTQVTTGADLPVTNGVHAVKVTSVWKGPCPKDWRPGDMSVPGGIQYNAAATGQTAQAGAAARP
ncbi:DUF3617 family protein [Phenylobacterium sp.]|uniref:DUF3617 domain-containing protein n=1 Tax=Phenylobacterium sp. TaxID=1871053 RepID=UPI00289E0A49|nr:DUF3617 family protein [Phenylobacterium sp.]